MSTQPTSPSPVTVLTADALRAHWLGHRALTRRVIDAFPEHELFTFGAGGMRPFAQLATEMLQMVAPTMRGAIDDVWEAGGYGKPGPTTKAGLLEAWDEADRLLADGLSQIPAGRFHQVANAFGMWTAPVYTTLLYLIDNEVHHRGQGYVYLRMLGITPPAFYDRPTPAQPEGDTP